MSLKQEKWEPESALIPRLRAAGHTLTTGLLRQLALDGYLPCQLTGRKSLRYRYTEASRAITNTRNNAP